MPIWSRRREVPAQALAALDLEPGERPLAAATTVTFEHVVATDRALWLPGPGRPRPLPWASIDRAGWDRESATLVVVEAAGPGSGAASHRLRIEEPGRLVDVVREQVTSSVVVSRRVPVLGPRGVRVVGRRRPGQDRLQWSVAVDAGLDLADPGVKARVDAALARVRSEVGE